jgi:hypothetical protein
VPDRTGIAPRKSIKLGLLGIQTIAHLGYRLFY